MLYIIAQLGEPEKQNRKKGEEKAELGALIQISKPPTMDPNLDMTKLQIWQLHNRPDPKREKKEGESLGEPRRYQTMQRRDQLCRVTPPSWRC